MDKCAYKNSICPHILFVNAKNRHFSSFSLYYSWNTFESFSAVKNGVKRVLEQDCFSGYNTDKIMS